jgi:hypothetical protein
VYVGVLISLWLFLFAAQPKEIFLDGLKKLDQRSHKCMELRGEYVNNFFFNLVACCFLYKAKDLSAPLVRAPLTLTLQNSEFSPKTVFMCFIQFSQ